MKKIYTAILAAAALLAAACAKNEIPAGTDGLVFTASIEGAKTVLGEGDKIYWEEGDEISICGITYTAAPDATDKAKAVFTKKNSADPDPTPVEGKYIAGYPATMIDGGSAVLPAAQVYDGPGSLACVNPMYAESTTQSLAFKNICGLLELKVKGSATVTSIEVRDAAKALSGAFTIVDDAAVLTDEALAAGAGVTLSSAQGTVLDENGTLFHVALPAGTYQGLSIRFTDNAGKCFTANLKEGVSAQISRSHIYPIELTPEFSAPGALCGIFTVGNGVSVQFACGNLYYDGSAWKMEENQWDCGGEFSASHVAHFFWTKGGSKGYGADTDYSAGSDTTVDWGEVFCTGSGRPAGEWTTLSAEQWKYLLSERTMTCGSPRYTSTVASPITIDGKQCSGLFIYPDAYSGSTVDESFTWNAINAAGIVFLPAAGRRSGSTVSYNGTYGWYWASDCFNAAMARCISFGPERFSVDRLFGRYMGYSVRLVTPCTK